MASTRNRRTPEGGVLIAGIGDVMHEYRVINGQFMYRRLRDDGMTPDKAPYGVWHSLSDDEILNRHSWYIAELNQWFAEYGITQKVVDEARERAMQEKTRRGRPRRAR